MTPAGVHRLSELLRAPVVGPDGDPVGRVVDLTLRLSDHDPVVDRVLVGRRHAATVALPWADVEGIAGSTMRLHRASPPARSEVELDETELRLGRDVLDTQIIDLDGRRLVRVADVVLEQTRTSQLVAVAVDIGIGSLCRRLGLRSLAERLPEHAVEWSALHLTSARGHAVQLATPKAKLHRLDADELALLLGAVAPDAGAELLAAVHPELAAAALGAAPVHIGRRLVRALPEARAAHLMERLPREHAERIRRSDATVSERRYRRHHGWHRRVPVPPSDERPT